MTAAAYSSATARSNASCNHWCNAGCSRCRHVHDIYCQAHVYCSLTIYKLLCEIYAFPLSIPCLTLVLQYFTHVASLSLLHDPNKTNHSPLQQETNHHQSILKLCTQIPRLPRPISAHPHRAFHTPGNMPSDASFRNMMRDSPVRESTARGLPVNLHRMRMRVAAVLGDISLSFRCAACRIDAGRRDVSVIDLRMVRVTSC